MVGVVLAAELIAAVLTCGLIAEVRAHAAVERVDGPNLRGFRGPLRLKAVGGARVAVIGGSAAYGLRAEWLESFPHYLEGALNQAWRTKYPHIYTEVINLAAVGDGSASYITTLQDYAYLAPDVVCILDGFAGLGATGRSGARRESTVFAHTGLMPILGDVIAHRAPWSSADRAVVDPVLRDDTTGDPSCDAGSRAHCDAMIATVAWTVDHGMAVAVVTPPYVSARHAAQQESLAARLAQRFDGNPRVHYLNMGRQIDVTDPKYSFDAVHLTPAGSQALAETLADPMFDVLRLR